MDKYEYKLRSEQIQDLISKKEYAKAMHVADEIDWSRVKNISMLTIVSDLYKINRRYDVARDLLLFAYDRSPGKRSIVFSLCELSIKLGDIVRAVEYYKEFNQIAPTDSGRYILKYKIFKSQEVSIEERIALLEALKAEDYRPKWAYELAYLYHRAGMESQCISECDELILTFGEGKYVLDAMELKKLHTPLNPVQQDKYDAWMGYKVKPTTTDAAKASLGRADLMQASTKVMPTRDIDIQVKTMDVENKYNTMNIQAALADSMKEIMAKDEVEKPSAPETGADVTKFMPSADMAELKITEENGVVSVTTDKIPVAQVAEQEPVVSASDVDAQATQVIDRAEIRREEKAQNVQPVQEVQTPHLAFDPNMDTAQLIQNMTARAEAAAANPYYEGMVSQEGDGQMTMVVPDEPKVEKQITGQLNIGDIMNEWEQKKIDNEQRSMDDIRQRMVRQTGRIFSDFDKSAKSGMLEGLEDVHNPLTNLPITPAKPVPPPKTNAEKLIEAALLDEDDYEEDLPEVEELAEIIEPATQEMEEAVPAMEQAQTMEESEIPAEVEMPAEAETVEELEAEPEEFEAEADEQFYEEQEPAVEETGSGDDFTIGADFSTSEIADVAEKLLEETERQVAGEDSVPTTPRLAPDTRRELSEDEKELFGALIQTDQMKEQIATAIDAVSLATYTGNVIITGEAGSGTLTLAKNLIKNVQMSDNNFSGKAAKISGASLDKQDIEKTLAKLKNGALIIEKANGMSPAALQRLCSYLDADHEEGIIVIMEDTKMEMRKLLNKYKAATNCFNARIDINAMDSDALVAYAKEYAYDQEYAVDELGVLAIYTRISDLQSGDHNVTLQEVRDIMDEGIWSANRKTIGHYFDILSGKRYDDEDMIILREKDFIC